MRRTATVLLWLLLTSAPSAGQQAAEAPCSDGRVTRVFVDNHSVFDLDELEGAPFQWAYRLANRLHFRTRPSFLRREVLLAPGDCWDPFLAEDSGRLLRRLPFIARSDVYGVQQPDGDWHLVIDTQDEWTTVVEAGADFDRGIRLKKFELREENFLGRGFVTGFDYRLDDAQRRMGGELSTPRLFNTRIDGRIRAGETRVGSYLGQELFYPFVGEVGRIAARQSYLRDEDYFAWSVGTPDAPEHLILPLDRESIELSVAARFGEPGNLSVFGIGLSRDRLRYRDPSEAELVVDNAFGNPAPAPPERAALLTPQLRYRAGARINVLFGQRRIRFEQRVGLDALRGVQDLEVGTEFGLTVGRSIGVAGGEPTPDDVYTRARAYAAAAPGPFVVVSSLALEGRHVLPSRAPGPTGWRDVLGEFDLLAYWQPGEAPRHTFFFRVAAAGGWRVDQPFQLTLGGPAGVRGFHDEDFPGSRRIVLSAEDRIFFGWPFPDLVDLGATVFADVGRMWADQLGLGVDSGWRGTVGAGLRVGFPAGTRTVARIDAAMPFGAGAGFGDLVFRVSFTDLLGLAVGLEDEQMANSRRTTIGPDRFNPERFQR